MPLSKPQILSSFFLVMVMIFSGCSDKSDPAPAGSRVSIFPTSTDIISGEPVVFTLELNNVGDVFFVAFDLVFEPAMLEFVEAQELDFLNQGGSDATSFEVSTQEATQGRVSIGLTRLGNIGGVSGSGELLTLTFKTLGPGTSSLVIEDPKGIRNAQNQEVHGNAWEGAVLTVQ